MSAGDIFAPAIVALAGGVGGAKLAHGLAQHDASGLAVIVNTGDDFRHLGLFVSPDIDTVLYTLSGLANRAQGWGVEGESWAFMDQLRVLGGADWFSLGDRDLALHVLRTMYLATGRRLTAIVGEFAGRFGIASTILPMTDAAVPTVVVTPDADLTFQDYFVRLRCDVPVTGFRFEGMQDARPTPEIVAALTSPELRAIIICPSNLYVSIDPILAVPGMRALLKRAGVPVVAVSPIVGGMAIKGPAAKMMRELGHAASARAVAAHYRGLIDGLVIDNADAAEVDAIRALGMKVLVTDAVMNDDAGRKRLAGECRDFATAIAAKS